MRSDKKVEIIFKKLYITTTTMADHVAAVCRSCYCQLRQLRSVARSLSAEAVKAVVHAFILCRLDYCNSLLTGVNDGLLRVI